MTTAAKSLDEGDLAWQRLRDDSAPTGGRTWVHADDHPTQPVPQQ